MPAIGAALVQKNLLEGEIVGSRAVEPAAAHLKFRLLRESEGDWAEPAVLASRMHADQPGAALEGQRRAGVHLINPIGPKIRSAK